jgi:uncharacterized protein involved in outer membrane biogenesis
MAGNWKEFVESMLVFSQRRKKILLSVAALLVAYTLLGFFLAPWLVKKNAISAVYELYGAELRIDKVAVNPFVLSLRIDGLQMDDPDGSAFAQLEQFYGNFQLSSLFRWALTFAEIRFDSPELFLVRDQAGNLNLSFLTATDATAEEDTIDDESSMLRLIVHDFSVNEASTHWNDAVPQEPVVTTFGPVNARIFDLNTLPQREGQQEVVITTETTGTLSWSGSLQLNPLKSAGHASIRGSHFPLLSAYIRDSAGFEVVRGNADVDLDYAIDTLEDGNLSAKVDGFNLAFSNVLLRTFGITGDDGSDIDRDVLNVPGFRIDGGTLRFPEQTVAIGSIGVDDSVLSLYRDASGQLNIVPRYADTEELVDEVIELENTEEQTPWSVSLESFDIRRMAVGLIDDSVTPKSELGLQELSINVSAINNKPATQFPTTISMRTGDGGNITSNGTIGALPNPVADLDVVVEGISLALLHPYIKSLADVNLDSGAFGMSAKMHTGPGEPLSLNGDIAVTNFLITETDEGSRLGSWETFALNQVALSLGKEELGISEIRIDRPYGDIFIAEDGSVNLGRVAPGVQTVEESDEAEPVATVAEVKESTELPLDVTIGRVVINDAAADFADFSLPLPFDAKIAALNGTLTTIASASSEPSEVALEGKVDEFGLVQISGSITPLDVPFNTDVKIRFENVAMPKFSAYTVAFAGRQIASGKLDLDLGYTVKESELVGENKVVLRDFELGEKIDHPGAMSLPLGLAVALLKDPDGSIDIDVPVRGNIDDPSFRYGRVIGKALVNLVVKIVASPFALLGKLVGAEADELEYIAFQDGRADLTPPEQEKAGKLAEALSLRPELNIEIHGVVNRDADGLALRTARLDEQVEAQIGELTAEDGSDAMYAERRTEVLKDIFARSVAAEEQEIVLAELRAKFTTTAPIEEGEKSLETFDELAYSAEIRRLLIDAQELAESDFVTLASERAANVDAAIIAANPELGGQTVVGDSQAVEKDKDDAIRMKVILTAGEREGSDNSDDSDDSENESPVS